MSRAEQVSMLREEVQLGRHALAKLLEVMNAACSGAIKPDFEDFAEPLAKLAGAMRSTEQVCDELAQEGGADREPASNADSMLSDVHSYLSDARAAAAGIAQAQLGRESTVAHEDLVKLMGSLHGAEQALDMVIDSKEAAGG